MLDWHQELVIQYSGVLVSSQLTGTKSTTGSGYSAYVLYYSANHIVLKISRYWEAVNWMLLHTHSGNIAAFSAHKLNCQWSKVKVPTKELPHSHFPQCTKMQTHENKTQYFYMNHLMNQLSLKSSLQYNITLNHFYKAVYKFR